METVGHRVDSAAREVGFTVPGNVLSTNAEQLRGAIFEVLNGPEVRQMGSGTVELDLRRASMVDSVGLNLLVAILKKVKALGSRTRFLVRDNSVARTFQFTRLNEHAEVVRVE
jgi:anti-anti-sigma factor